MPRLVPVSYRRLVQVFEEDGWQYSRTKGDHLIYTKPGNIRPLVIPAYGEVPVFIIKNMLPDRRDEAGAVLCVARKSVSTHGREEIQRSPGHVAEQGDRYLDEVLRD